MFYAENILTKKGPLANIWIATHWDKKLNKTQIANTDIKKSIDYILSDGFPPMALRLSSQLLLGAVKIYTRKTNYLYEECSDAYTRMKISFRPTLINIPREQAVSSITLQEVNNLPLPDIDIRHELIKNAVKNGPSKNSVADPASINLSQDFSATTLGSTQIPTTILGDKGFDTGLDIDFDFDFNLDEPSAVVPVVDNGGGRLSDLEIEVGRRDDAAAASVRESLISESAIFGNGPNENISNLKIRESSSFNAAGTITDSMAVDGMGEGGEFDEMMIPFQEIDAMLTNFDEKGKKAETSQQQKRAYSRRKKQHKSLELDDQIEIPRDLIKKHLNDVSDIIRSFDVPIGEDDFLNKLHQTFTETFETGSFFLDNEIQKNVLANCNTATKRKLHSIAEEETTAEEGIYYKSPKTLTEFVETFNDDDFLPETLNTPSQVDRLSKNIVASSFGTPMMQDTTNFNDFSLNNEAIISRRESSIQTTSILSPMSPSKEETDIYSSNFNPRKVIQEHFNSNDVITFASLNPATRREASSLFYEVLKLKTRGCLGEVSQEIPFAEIILTKGQNMNLFDTNKDSVPLRNILSNKVV